MRLEAIETFVDGAAVRRVGDLTFAAVRATLDVMHLVPEGRVCTSVLELYNREGLVVEPAGALAVAALDDFAGAIRGRKVVCVISGGNADVDRLAEIKERSLRHEGLKHYFLVRHVTDPAAAPHPPPPQPESLTLRVTLMLNHHPAQIPAARRRAARVRDKRAARGCQHRALRVPAADEH